MEVPSQASPEDLRGLASWLTSWSWPVDDQAFLELIASRHWTILVEKPGKSYVYDTGLVGSRPWATVTLVDAQVSDLTVTTADVLAEDTSPGLAAPARRLRRPGPSLGRSSPSPDRTFSRSGTLGVVDAADGVQQKPGSSPSASWDLENGSSLKVGASAGCYWVLTSPEFVEIQRDLGRDV